MSEKCTLEQRLALKDELDTALESGELTLDRLRAIPPTATSIEHHTSLMKALKAKEAIAPQNDSIDAMAFLATKNALEELLYKKNAAFAG